MAHRTHKQCTQANEGELHACFLSEENAPYTAQWVVKTVVEQLVCTLRQRELEQGEDGGQHGEADGQTGHCLLPREPG